MAVRKVCFKEKPPFENIGFQTVWMQNARAALQRRRVLRNLGWLKAMYYHVLGRRPRSHGMPGYIRRGEDMANNSLACALVSEQDAQIAKIVSSGAGHDRVAERLKKRIGIESSERIPRRIGFTAASGTVEGAAIDDRSGRWTVSVDAVGAGT
jgi:hypothetical protein